MSGTYQHWMRIMASAARSRGVDLQQHLAPLGLVSEEADASGARLSVRQTRALWNAAEDLLDDPVLGMTVLRNVDFRDFGELGLVLAAGGGLREMLGRIVRFHRLISESVGMQIEEQGDRVTLIFKRNAQAHWRSEESAAALVVGSLRMALGPTLTPLSVSFMFDNPAGLEAYERFYRCPVSLHRPDTRLVFDAASSQGTHPMARSAASFDAILEQQLERLGDGGTWAERVAAVLEHHLMDVEPTLAMVAGHLHVSERSLQRHLNAQGSRFRDIVDQVRKSQAQAWLEGHGAVASCRSLTELAMALGFSTSAALTKAFYRWFGMAPSKAKERQAHSRRPG